LLIKKHELKVAARRINTLVNTTPKEDREKLTEIIEQGLLFLEKKENLHITIFTPDGDQIYSCNDIATSPLVENNYPKDAGDFKEEAALSLGAVAYNLRNNNQAEAADRLNEKLVSDLKSATTNKDKETMLDALGNSGDNNNFDAIFHEIGRFTLLVGQAVKMDYGPCGSGAFSYNAVNAILNNFKFDNGISAVQVVQYI